ncbi:hypothetical protein C9374_003216 [Naegleria lovaniensis]|uniref:Zn(2)-C6 fungal-type domain-containing protein n=1 Tax=Naegleria lovaniensis TaxID=51637 RepID=A0AA88KQ55_NAELO|nr:uncharacterized protein C9374_003216 [Naegleria lovaniensis]KAG2386067.1 hypothetical protein C9374_003216 [Naegleria lovaniensis]
MSEFQREEFFSASPNERISEHHSSGEKAMNNFPELFSSSTPSLMMNDFEAILGSEEFHDEPQQPHQEEYSNEPIMSTNLHEYDVEGFHPISCAFCRKNHRKCDRKKPSCTNCIKKGVACVYSDPRKKGRKKKNEKNQNKEASSHSMNEMHSNQIDGSPHATTSKKDEVYSKQHISEPYDTSMVRIDDSYYSIVALKRATIDMCTLIDSPISKIELERLFIQAESDTNCTNDIKAVLFAVQAVVEQRIGLKDSSKLSFKRARELIQPYFDEFDNFYVGCTYLFLGMFEVANGAYKRAQFYSNILGFFVNQVRQLESKNLPIQPRMKKLMQVANFLQMSLETSSEIDVENPLAIAKLFPNMVFAATGMQELSKLTEKLAKLEKDKLDEYFTVIDMVTQIVHEHMKMQDEAGDKRPVLDMMRVIVSNGMKLAAILTVDSNNLEQIMLYSSNITKLTESEYFFLIPSASISHIAHASKQHLRALSMLKLGFVPPSVLESYDIKALIFQDLRALNILKGRFDRVEKYYSSLLNELEIVVKEMYTEQQEPTLPEFNVDDFSDFLA